MSSANDLTIQFWGVRGSVASSERNQIVFGGNTACISVQMGEEPSVILDAGTGLRLLGQRLQQGSGEDLEATILFSHFHWDHIQGFPFFQPLYNPRTRLHLCSAFEPAHLEEALCGQMQIPYFPVPYSAITARTHYDQIGRDGLEIGSLFVRPITLNHPGGCFGYRVDAQAGSLVYITDHEHGNAEIDSQIARAAEGAKVLIYDAHFTPDEYLQHRGWGHSTWLEGTRLAKHSGVECLVLFHHNPLRSDREVEHMLVQARHEFSHTEAARERKIIVLSDNRVPA